MKKILRVSDLPDLLQEWDYAKNKSIQPDGISYGDNRCKVWWVCDKGHSWQSTVSNRYHGNGCPYCKGKRVIVGETDLASQRPDLMLLWDYSQEVLPSEISQHSGKSVFWICSNKHRWKARVSDVAKKTRCPVCANRRILAGLNDLGTIRPDLAKEWNYERNGELTPEMVAPSAKKSVWWICQHGHSWKTNIYNRYNGSKCPYCSGNKPISGINDLASLRPDLANEWCYDLNNESPHNITLKSNKRVWWKCGKGHNWKASVYERSVNGTVCPYCCGKRAIPEENDLMTLYPELCKEWDYQLNLDVDPKRLRPFSGKYVWWKCKYGHSWKTQVITRTNGKGCPYCKGKTPIRTSLI